MRRIKTGLVLATALVMGLSLFGCGSKKTEENVTTTEAKAEVDVSQADMMKSATAVDETYHEGVYNDLTGEWNTDRKEEYGRPIAIMINNIENAIPQSGIGQADVLYEFVVEGGITRMLAIFNDYDNLEKVGSIRSCRPYYVTTAMEFDAIYMHYGQSPQGQEAITPQRVTVRFSDCEGVAAEVTRDGGIEPAKDSRKMSETVAAQLSRSGDTIFDVREVRSEGCGLDYLGCSTTHNKGYKSKFEFNEEDTVPEGESVNKLTLNMSVYTQPWFEYDSKNKVYNRFQYGDKQIDDLTGKQLTFKNIIIQFAHYTSIDDHDRQMIDLVGTGDGYYVSDGKIVPITWTKSTDDSVTKYSTADGKELQLNPGKTYVTVFESDNKAGVVWE